MLTDNGIAISTYTIKYLYKSIQINDISKISQNFKTSYMKYFLIILRDELDTTLYYKVCQWHATGFL
jgi:hypothetical protein